MAAFYTLPQQRRNSSDTTAGAGDTGTTGSGRRLSIDDRLRSSKRISYTRRKLFEDYETRIRTTQSVDILHSDEEDVMEKVADTLTLPSDEIQIKKLFLMRGLTTEGAKILGEKLPFNKTLTVLKLLQNAETFDSLPILLTYLKKNTTITDLVLNDCPFGGSGSGENDEEEEGERAAEALIQVLIGGTIQRLSITNVPSFGRWTALIAQKAMKHPNCQLKQVKLIRCGIDGYGTQSIADALTTPHTQLTLLNLEGNQVGDDGAVVLARALQTNTRLEQLILGRNCHIGDRGVEAIADMLPHNNTLGEVYLAGNTNINIRGKEALAVGCRRNIRLVTIGMSVRHRHPIRPTVLEQITNSLGVNSARQSWNEHYRPKRKYYRPTQHQQQQHDDSVNSTNRSALLPHYLARVAAKPAILFLALQENGDLFLPYLS